MTTAYQYPHVIEDICQFDWQGLDANDMVSVAWAYYYFSIQFRESLKAARSLYPLDEKLMRLEQEECDTPNLSPWPGVAAVGEPMNHDEFMRRTLTLLPIDPVRQAKMEAAGAAYLETTRSLDIGDRASSIASYEDGGLEAVFTAILTFRTWNSPMLKAFEHFLSEHVRFDSDPEQGHGALSRHMKLDDGVLPLWQAFKDILLECTPNLAVRVLEHA